MKPEIDARFTMAPPPLCRITSAAWRVQSAVPTTFTPSERCQSSTLASSPFRTNTAASFTNTSRRPWRSDTTPNACATSASRAMSVRTKSAGAPAARRRAATSSPAGSTSRSTTEAPSSANSSAVASPIPAAAPVTAATLPASRPRSLIEDESLAGAQPRCDLGAIHLALDLVGDEERERIAGGTCLADGADREPVPLGPLRAGVADRADEHLHSAVAQVQRLRPSLIAVADDGDRLAVQMMKLGVGVVKHPHGAPPAGM